MNLVFTPIKKVESLDEVKMGFDAIEKNGAGWFSNLLATDEEMNRWIQKAQLFYTVSPTTVLLLRQRQSFQRCFFATTQPEIFAAELKVCLASISGTVIMSILDRSGENQFIKNQLVDAGFVHYALLKRVVKINKSNVSSKASVEFAAIEDSSQIEAIIHRYFDPLLDHWPDTDEVIAAIQHNRVIVARLPGDNKIAAFNSFEIKGQTFYSRYLASVKEYRNYMPFAPIILRQNLKAHADAKKCIAWIHKTNDISIRMHFALGFSFDGATEEYFRI